MTGLSSRIFMFCIVLALSLTNIVQGFSAVATKKVLVVGASGRVGRLVVDELVKQNLKANATFQRFEVKGLVRNKPYAQEVVFNSSINSGNTEFWEAKRSSLSLVECNLGNTEKLKDVLRQEQCDAVIWCAAGFTDSPSTGIISKLVAAAKLKFNPKKSIDITGLETIGSHYAQTSEKSKVNMKDQGEGSGNNSNRNNGVSVVMCSSAGVTRPSWGEEKKRLLEGAADIPIVRLNPLNILGVKAESEQALRGSGCSYAIVRPCGLNDAHPSGSRAVLAQGDVAVGRISRVDVAALLVNVLLEPTGAARGKTFEAIAMAGLPVPRSLTTQLSRLRVDGEKGVEPTKEEEAAVLATYNIMQQLVPGQIMAPQGLAMGQTYEQLDKEEAGRLGKRGEEKAPIREEK